MLVLGSLHEKHAALSREFALVSRTKVDEMSLLLQESIDTFEGEILARIQVILHDLKGKAARSVTR